MLTAAVADNILKIRQDILKDSSWYNLPYLNRLIVVVGGVVVIVVAVVVGVVVAAAVVYCYSTGFI